MKSIYIHAGYHKTGTTSIQIVLTREAERLARHGILYPTTGRPESARFGQHELAWSLMRRPNYLPAVWARRSDLGAGAVDRLFDTLCAEIDASNCKTVLLSSEEFDCLDGDEIAALGARLQGYAVTPILFLRRFPAFVEAAYKTSVLHGGLTAPIADFAARQRSRMDLGQVVRDWRGIASSGAAHLIDYDDASVRTDALAALLGCVGIDVPGLQRGETRWNPSYSAALIELLRRIRLEGATETELKAWIKRAPAAVAADRSHSLIDGALHDSLDARYAAELEAVKAISDPAIRLTGRFSADHEPFEASPVASLREAILGLW